MTKGRVDPSWMSLLHDWWLRHGYYPEQAAQLGQDGQVRIEIVVDRYGKVRNLELLRSSRSPWLDLAAQGVFRNAQLPPFPANTSDNEITLDLTINYILTRQ
ncbi:MAG: energy transducer TonB [Acetobacteraceae bacterium]